MTNTYTTPIYAALLALFFVALSVRTLRMRRKLGIAVGDGGNEQMLRTMRVHANFAEYAPLTLLLIFMLELSGGRTILVHALCLCLFFGRVVNSLGMSKLAENYRYRVSGMAMTFTALGGAAAAVIVNSLL